MLNLTLHCGGHRAEREDVARAATPDRTPSWVPVPHHRVLAEVETALTGGGLAVVGEAHALWGDGQRYFGLLEVAGDSAPGEAGLVVGIRNSHDQTFPASIALGHGVFVCDNLSFFGEVTIARRHTRHIERDLPRVVHTAVARLTDMRSAQDRRVAAYQATQLEDRLAHDLVIRALDAGALPVTQLPVVLSEWRSPRHAEFSAAGKTAWRLFNAFTSAWKGRHLLALPRRSQALHGIMDVVCGLAV